MNEISLITPPDRLYTDAYSFLLIHPSKVIREQFQQLLAEIDVPMHVYLYEVEDEEKHEPEWLIDVFQIADTVILDIDNCPSMIRDLTGYFLSKDKTYWLTNAEGRLYNIINKHRLYDLDYLKEKIGGTLEKKK